MYAIGGNGQSPGRTRQYHSGCGSGHEQQQRVQFSFGESTGARETRKDSAASPGHAETETQSTRAPVSEFAVLRLALEKRHLVEQRFVMWHRRACAPLLTRLNGSQSAVAESQRRTQLLCWRVVELVAVAGEDTLTAGH